jgi:hypothetical protein
VSETARALKRSLRWLAIGALALAGLAAGVLVIALLVNLRDEALAPATRALLSPPPNRFGSAENIYVALQGFDAPPAESVMAAGEARIERYNRGLDAALRDPSPARVDRLRLPELHRLGFKGDISFIRPLELSVWDEAPRHMQEITTLLADNHELLERYLALILLPGYYETARPSALLPSATPPNELRRLFLAQLALQMQASGRIERQLALAGLEGDIGLWRRVLTGEGGLLWKMLAIAFLQSDYLLLADLIADPATELAPGDRYGDALVPLFDAADFDLGGAFAAEFRIQAATLRNPGADAHADAYGWLEQVGNRLSDHFLKLNATENLLASDTLGWMARAADPARFRERTEASSRWLLPVSYNPLGELLCSMATQSYRHYPPRAWDEAALQRLVRAAYEIRQHRLGPAEVGAFLRGHPQWSTHPADGRPFLFDAATHELRMQPLAPHPPTWRFSVRIWQPPAAG